MSDQQELILKALMEIKQDIGALQQDSASSISQRTLLFEKVNDLQTTVTSLKSDFNNHSEKFDTHVADEEEVFKQVAEHEAVLSPFRDAKTKALGILAILAIFGGSIGSQAEKLFLAVLGK